MPSRLGRGQHGDTPVMKLCHTVGELAGQFTAGQVYILKRRCRITMPSERGNGMQFPACMGKVGQAEVTQRVRAEAGHAGGQSNPPYDLGPGPGVSGAAWLRRDFDRNSGPRAVLIPARCPR